MFPRLICASLYWGWLFQVKLYISEVLGAPEVREAVRVNPSLEENDTKIEADRTTEGLGMNSCC